MSRNETIPPAAMVAASKKIEEIAGLLAMLKPLCRRAKQLTQAEQEVFVHTVNESSEVMRRLWLELHEARYGPIEPVRDLAPAKSGRPI